MNNTIFVLFNKYCPIVDQLGSKDSSRDFQLNCVISYFLPISNTPCKRLKFDVMKRVKKFGILRGTKQDRVYYTTSIHSSITSYITYSRREHNKLMT
jgi:hypothetical protein